MPHLRSPVGIAKAAASLLLGVVALVGGCDKSDQTRAAFELHRKEWGQRISALRSRTSDLEQRYKGLPPLTADSTAAAQAHRRGVQASILGARQTLADIEAHVADSAGHLETAIRQGDAEGDEALNSLIARVDGYVRQQEQALVATEETLIRMGGTQP